MGKLEADVVKQIKSRLSSGSLSGVIIWWMRLQVGSFKVDGRYIRTAKELVGTPDFIALVRNKQDNITALFIEAKSDTGCLRPEQKAFSDKYNKFKDVAVVMIRDIKELNAHLDLIEKDLVNEMRNPG